MKKGNYIAVFFSLVMPYKYLFIVLFFCVNITVFIGATYPYITGLIIDKIVISEKVDELVYLVIVFIGAYILNLGFHTCLNYLWTKMETSFVDSIRIAAVNKILSYRGEELSKSYSGDILNRINEDVEHFAYFLYTNLIYSFGEIIRIVICLLFFINLSWNIMVIMVLCIGIAYFGTHLFTKKGKQLQRNFYHNKGKNSSWIIEMISGIDEIKGLSAEKNVLTQYIHKSKNNMEIQYLIDKNSYWQDIFSKGVVLFARVCLLYILTNMFMNNSITFGMLTCAHSYYLLGQNAFIAICTKISKSQYNMVAIRRVIDLFLNERECEEGDILCEKITTITFSEVSFAYTQGQEVLSDFTWEVPSSLKIGIVGQSGEGKSTIVNLLCKIYNNQSGNIYINKLNINQISVTSLRENIGIIHQEGYLLSASIRENLLSGNPNIRSDEQIWDVLKKVGLDEMIQKLHNGIDTMISERQNLFSSGQKQKLQIAKILLKNPAIIIFDEALRALDKETEELMLNLSDELCIGRILIIISHKRKIIDNLDKVAVLDGGKIVAFDSPDVLEQECIQYSYLLGGENSENTI